MNEFEDEMKKAVKEGYIKEDGFPIKCWKCRSSDLKFIEYYDDHIMIEQKVKCNKCDADVGLWSYGQWTVVV